MISKRVKASRPQSHDPQDAPDEVRETSSTVPYHAAPGSSEVTHSESTKAQDSETDFSTLQQPGHVDDEKGELSSKLIRPTPALIEDSERGHYRGVTGSKYALADVARRLSCGEGGMDVSSRKKPRSEPGDDEDNDDEQAVGRRSHDKRRESDGSSILFSDDEHENVLASNELCDYLESFSAEERSYIRDSQCSKGVNDAPDLIRRPTGTGFTIAVEDEEGKVGEISELF